jgi:hypothetical protein
MLIIPPLSARTACAPPLVFTVRGGVPVIVPPFSACSAVVPGKVMIVPVAGKVVPGPSATTAWAWARRGKRPAASVTTIAAATLCSDTARLDDGPLLSGAGW